MGAPEDVIAAAVARKGDDDYEVWPENWPAVKTFCSLAHQWRRLGGGLGPSIRLGLDYGAVESVFRLTGVRKKDRPEMFAALQLMEAAVLEVDRERPAPEARTRR